MIFVDEIKNKFVRYQYPGDLNLSYIYVLDAKYEDDDLLLKTDFYFNYYTQNNEIRVVKKSSEVWSSVNEESIYKINEKEYPKIFSYIFKASRIYQGD